MGCLKALKRKWFMEPVPVLERSSGEDEVGLAHGDEDSRQQRQRALRPAIPADSRDHAMLRAAYNLAHYHCTIRTATTCIDSYTRLVATIQLVSDCLVYV